MLKKELEESYIRILQRELVLHWDVQNLLRLLMQRQRPAKYWDSSRKK